MPLASLPDLASLEGLSPYLNQAGMQQVQDVQGYNQIANQQAGADLTSTNLKNIFDAERNPLMVEQQRLQNIGTGYTNDKLGVESRIAQGTESENMQAKRSEFLKNIETNKLETMLSQATQMTYSDDPAIRKKGQEFMDAGYKEVMRRRVYQEDLEKQREELRSREGIAAGNNSTAIKVAEMNNQGRVDAAKARAKTASTVSQQIAAAKTPQARQSVYLAAAMEAAQNGDAEAAQSYRQSAQFEAEQSFAERQAGGTGGRPDQINVPALTNLPSTAPVTAPVRPGASTSTQQPAAKPTATLRFNPATGKLEPIK